jgi:uncharacterized protein (TIGR03083 family)
MVRVMKAAEAWTYIHAERAALAETWSGLSPEQWASPSWCDGWTVQVTAGHVLAAAEQTPLNFYKEMALAGFRFNVFADRAARRLGQVSPQELIRRLQARTTTTNRPPAPVLAMLGEVIVHGEDIRRPLGLTHPYPEAALVGLADNYTKTNLLIGAKRRIAGLRLRATDCGWTHGDGPEVEGPLTSLVPAMAGRRGTIQALTGERVPTLSTRM